MPVLDKDNSAALARYRRFVEQSPYGTLYQDPRWRAVKAEWESAFVYLERGGEITAALSLLIKRTGPFSMLYAPRGPVCDPKDTGTIKRLIAEAEPVARAHRAFLLRMDPPVRHDEDLRQKYEATGFCVRGREANIRAFIQPRLNMVLYLKGETEETLFPKLSKTGRKYVRSAQREGVRVRHSRDKEALDALYSLYAGTAERKHFGKRSYGYLKRLLEAYDGARIYLAEHEGDLLAAALCIRYNKNVWCAYSGTADIKPSCRANSLIRWEMIKWAISEGCETFDLGGVFAADSTDGLYEFKERFCHKDGHTEYIGELDYVYRPVVYAMAIRFGPFVLRRLRRLRKRLKGLSGGGEKGERAGKNE